MAKSKNVITLNRLKKSILTMKSLARNFRLTNPGKLGFAADMDSFPLVREEFRRQVNRNNLYQAFCLRESKPLSDWIDKQSADDIALEHRATARHPVTVHSSRSN